MKEIFDKRTNLDNFQIGDVVLQWDAPREEKGKHGKFDHLWKGPYNISTFRGKNAYVCWSRVLQLQEKLLFWNE